MNFNYGNINFKKQINFPPDTRLIDALKELREEGSESPFMDVFVEGVEKDKSVSDIKIDKYLNRGSSAFVFETSQGDVLKLTEGNHFPLNRPHESFDVPILKQGKCGKIFYYIEEKMYQHGLSEGFVKIIRDKIKAKGYKASDLSGWDTHQIGLSEKGKLYLLDPECAKYKTIFHAIYDKIKRFAKRFL